MDNNLVSIILPVHNGETHISLTINSVLKQSHQNWELLVINDGSSDDTEKIVKQFDDIRIIYYKQVNKGVSTARNIGLSKMKGSFFCFLDADDLLSTKSLELRLKLFKDNSNLSFVDGKIEVINKKGELTSEVFLPKYTGSPYNELIKLKSSCFFGPSWMIKNKGMTYQFDTELHYCEDLFFFISISKALNYSFINETILFYRRHENSAMSDLRGLENGYILLTKKIKHQFTLGTWRLLFLKLKTAKIMFLSHTFDGKSLKNGIISIFRILVA